MGPAAKYGTANKKALEKQPWSASEMNNLLAQRDKLKAVPQVPGSYILDRYVNFAWLAVYNSGASPTEQLMDAVPLINAELTRKRTEFNMPVIPRDKFGRRTDTTD